MPDDLTARNGQAIRTAANQITVISTGDLGSAVYRRAQRIRRSRTVRRTTFTSVSVIAFFGLVVGVILTHSPAGPQQVHAGVDTGTPGTPAGTVRPRPATKPPAAKFPPQPRVTAVAGYDAVRASTKLRQCLAVMAPPAPAQGAVLRAAVTDSASSILLITTTAGWETCNVLPDGVATQGGSQAFETWAAGDGWSVNLGGSGPVTPAERLRTLQLELSPLGQVKAPTEAPDYYLTSAVEVISDGGGLVGEPGSAWRSLVIGRAAPAVTRVRVTMSSGSVVSAKVQNGMFIADQLTSSAPATGPGKPDTVWGYDAAGHLVYQSARSTSAVSCYATPAGQAVTSPESGQTCKIAVPWG